MSIFIGPVNAHPAEDPKPPGISENAWCYMVSSLSLLELQTFAAQLALSGVSASNIRTPPGSSVTYIALTSDQRADAVAAGALAAPTEGKARAKAFDGPAPGWEP